MNMILKRQKELKKKGKKGFTLIEVIVVIVIIAILAAIAVPALTGYIDKANQRSAISEARTVQIGLQAIGSDLYGNGTTMPAGVVNGSIALPTGYKSVATPASANVGAEIRVLSGGTIPSSAATGDYAVYGISWTGNTLAGFTYDAGKYIVNWTSGGGYVVS